MAYIDNLTSNASANPDVEICLWIDESRHSASELKALLKTIECKSKSKNIKICDLQDIEAYRSSSFFSAEETSLSWRYNKHSLIWRQVDAAKLLICLKQPHAQVFFADFDVVDIDLNHGNIQTSLEKHGMVFGGYMLPNPDRIAFENQFFGFTQQGRSVFEKAYGAAHGNGRNGYEHMLDSIRDFIKATGAKFEDMIYMLKYSGGWATHPTRDNATGQQPPTYSENELRF